MNYSIDEILKEEKNNSKHELALTGKYINTENLVAIDNLITRQCKHAVIMCIMCVESILLSMSYSASVKISISIN